MFSQQNKLIVIHQFPSVNIQPFLNPICKDTYNALPKIYGRKGKKRYLYNIQQIIKHQQITYQRECCNMEYQQRYRSNKEVKQKRKIKISAQFAKPKLENCKKSNCICHQNQSFNDKRHKNKTQSSIEIQSLNQKFKKILLPNLKQFNSQDLKESQSNHKIFKPKTSMSLDQINLPQSRAISKKQENKKNEMLSGRTSKNSYVQTDLFNFDPSKELKDLKVSKFNLETPPPKVKNYQSSNISQSKRYQTQSPIDSNRPYYQYLENDPKLRQSTDKRNDLTGSYGGKKSNKSEEDTFSHSSFNINNMQSVSTIFHKYKQKQTMSASKGPEKKKSKAYSVLSNGLFKIPEQQQFGQYIINYSPMNPEFDIKALVKEPNFHIVPTQGKLYFGQIENEKKNGRGITVSQKQIYEGNYSNNVKVFGCQKNIDGIYTGEFLKGKRHGNGKFVWNNHQTFEGQWRDGKKNGHGVWKSPKGDYYEGQWKQNRQSGKGYYYHHGGSKFRGYFINFLKHGKGEEQFANGDVYSGQYQSGKPHGYGKYVWSNGDTYEGYFVDGSREGQGTLKKVSGELYEGMFKNDQKHGLGKQKFKSGQYFEGQWKQGERFKGKLKAKNGAEISPEK